MYLFYFFKSIEMHGNNESGYTNQVKVIANHKNHKTPVSWHLKREYQIVKFNKLTIFLKFLDMFCLAMNYRIYNYKKSSLFHLSFYRA